MKKYEELDLPPLPPPWVWTEGVLDGDPSAVLRRDDVVVCVHEAEVCTYRGNLAVTLSPGLNRSSVPSPGGIPSPNRSTGSIPFEVFRAVHNALRQWYEVDD